MGHLTHEELLRILGLPTFAYRIAQGDMIETYKILKGVYDQDVCGNILEIRKNKGTSNEERSRLNKRKIPFVVE